ncbi:uncharacterized protein EI90DRAFT_3123742 [Cantharellus anzutake]|uniref:uncharacterized protein n=1 Tax=Cantharellus anzutake TaxID=1750568 RepID=UPI001904139F|nr:uncharacterized protein EI90DRAFT_3123742 [Cantharellus anzutake]KAF8331042.1 hypothetical protein EI90DRAFT_3123742 [Cantharellus anzutake]
MYLGTLNPRLFPDTQTVFGDYEISPECEGIEEDTIKAIDVISSGLKSAVIADDYQQWLIFASEYVDTVIWFAHQEALWNHWDEGIGFNTCYDVFEWLDSVHHRWISIPMQCLYALACERYLKSLPTESLDPPALLTPQQPLSPLPLGFTKPTPAVTSIPASKPQLNPIAASSDANALPAVAQPSPMPAEPILPTPTLTLESPKSHCHRQGQKKHQSEQHRPSVSTFNTPHSPSTAVPFPIVLSLLLPPSPSVPLLPYLHPLQYLPSDVTPLLSSPPLPTPLITLLPPPLFCQPPPVTTFHHSPIPHTQTLLVPSLQDPVMVPTSDFDSTSA